MIIIKYIHKLNKAKEGQVFGIYVSIRVKKKSRSSLFFPYWIRRKGKGREWLMTKLFLGAKMKISSVSRDLASYFVPRYLFSFPEFYQVQFGD